MGGAALAATEVTMATSQKLCMFCHEPQLEPATDTVVRERDGVKITVEGVPAMRCGNCGEVSFDRKVAIPVDAAIHQILVATGVAAPPDPDVDEQLRKENRELARSLGQEDTFLDEPAGVGRPA
jgi:YgiT-type zinc finger domain-containing protein